MLSGLPLLSDVSEISVLILAVNTNFLYLNLFFFFKSCLLIVVFFFKTAIYCLKLVFQSFCHLLCFDIFLKVFCAIRGAICFYVNDQATISGQVIIKNSRGYFMTMCFSMLIMVAKTNSNLTNTMSNSISLKSKSVFVFCSYQLSLYISFLFRHIMN